MRIRNKNFIGFVLAIVFGLVLLFWGGLPVTADDKAGINAVYEIDPNATDSGVTTVQGNRTIKDIKSRVGASKIVLLRFKAVKSGVTTPYTVTTGITLSANYYVEFMPGAYITGAGILNVASPGHVKAACNQLIRSGGGGSLTFTATTGLRCPAWDASGTTTVTIPTAQIDTLTLLSGVGVNEFSNDTALAGNSDAALPTEKAVKTYVDTNVFIPKYYKYNLEVGTVHNSSGVTSAASFYCVSVTADELTAANLTGNKTLLSGVSVTANVTVAGANGLEVGSSEANVLYYIWVCKYYSGTTTFALLSTSGTTPLAIPTDTYKRCVGEVLNSGGNFLLFRRSNDYVRLLTPLSIFANTSITVVWETFNLPSPVSLINWESLDLLYSRTTGGSQQPIVLSGTTNPANALASAGYWSDLSDYFFRDRTPDMFSLKRIGTADKIYVRTNHTSTYTGLNLDIIGYVCPR
jgi:hypothetical protein